MRRLTRPWVLVIVFSLVTLAGYFTWPWLRSIPKKLGPLANYRVYEESKSLDGFAEPTPGGWRMPASRWELFATLDHQVMFDKKQITSLRKKPNLRPSRPALPPPAPLVQGDMLSDFVVDRGTSFGFPATYQELDESLAHGKAYRESAFFMRYHDPLKPFYGSLPTRLCYHDTCPDRGNFRANYLQIREDFKLRDVSLETPKSPDVFIVAAGGIYNAREAAYRRSSPIAYPSDQYWAVVYAGSTHSSPTAFLLDRVTIAPTSTEILLHRPPPGGATADLHPYWFFIPLGRLPAGKYSVNVRLVDDNSLRATTTADLRSATDDEIASRNAKSEELQKTSNKHFKHQRQLEQDYGAELQLRLERLAEFIHSAAVDESDKQLLARDVARLGEAVDWDQDIYHTQRHPKRALTPPTPGETPTFRDRQFPWEPGDWKPSEIALSDIWLCDGTDADWYVPATYRNVPEFRDALTVDNPSKTQLKIREIWKAIESEDSSDLGTVLRHIPAAGTIEDAIHAAHDVLVGGKPPAKEFSPNDEMWCVFLAKRSYLIRRVDSRITEGKIAGTQRREFFVHLSAYIGAADTAEDDHRSPATLAIIPLGKQSDVDSVGVTFYCDTVCSRQVDQIEPRLLETQLPDSSRHYFSHYFAHGTGFLLKP